MSPPGRPAGGLSPLVPLAYLTCAAFAFVVAALGVAWLGPELAGHYYHPLLLALTHTVTLGWVTLAIMGASYQLIPIVLERPIWSERLARWQLAILAVAVTGMIAHFHLGTWPGLAMAAGLLAVGIALHLVNVGLSLRGFTRWTFTARLVGLGYGGLALTTLFGVALAANRVWPFLPGAFFPTLHAHVQLALLGWVTPMIFAVAARVYPMFFLAPAPRRGHSFLQLWGLAAGVPAVVLGLLGVPGLLVAGAVAVTVAAAAHAAWAFEMARGRKRPGLDWGLRFVLTATAFLAPAAVLGVALAADRLAGPRVALAYVVVTLGGWISLTIVGMMLKIVPFLVWYRAYSPQAGREPVPTLAQISWPRAEGLAYLLLTGGVVLLAATVLAGDAAWIRAAGAVLALGALAFAAALARVLTHLWTSRGTTPDWGVRRPAVLRDV
ncbi:MAG TPA: hypothetical protein VNC82_18380 [Candidatus Limnocylindria bacterium]|nr:hypothetical protein [Candidatus Limnocylindria bacterium]